MASNKLTYRKSGVNIPKADSFVKFISSLARKSSKSGDFKNIGGFGAISPIPRQLKDPHIVTSTDGVGTKIEIANDLNKFDTIGIDLVAMCVNDLIVQGAKPLLFLDYISLNKIDLKKLKAIIKNKKLPLNERFAAQLKLSKLPKNSSKIRIRNRCEITGRPHGVYRKLRISRIALRDLASKGRIPGMTKSSW